MDQGQREGGIVSSWVYVKSKGEELWTVGFYRPDGKWEAEDDYLTSEAAADRVHFLNGGDQVQPIR